MLRYLEAFAAFFDLGRVVRTQTEVAAVRPLPAAPSCAAAALEAGVGSAAGCPVAGWEVMTRGAGAAAAQDADGGSGGSAGGSGTVERFDAVVVCNG